VTSGTGGTVSGSSGTTRASGGTLSSAGGASGTLGASIGTVELYGTFEAMGVIATLPTGADPNNNAVANLEYRISGAGEYSPGLTLTRTGPTRFVGSLFWLTPGTPYDVRVRYIDQDGAPLDGAWVGGTASTRTEITIPAPARTLVVAPGGSGTACSTASPCALAQALNQAQAGDEVSLAAGTYYEGAFTLSKSGSATAPIVIRGASGAVLDGADPGSFAWTPGANGVFTTTVNQSDPHLVLAQGQRLYPYSDLASVTSLAASNTPGFFANGASVTVHLAAGADPTSASMQVSRYNNALTITGSFVYVLNLTFRNYGLGEYAKAIYIRDGNDNLVKGCRFVTNDLGIGLKGNTNRNVIEDNEFSDTIASWTWEDIKAEGNLETGGVRFYSPDDGRGTVIRRNKFHDFFDGLGICPNDSSAVTNETDFYENESYNNGDDGVETDGRCANVRLWKNVFHDTLSGVSLAPVVDGPIYCVRNLIYSIGAGHSEAGYSGLSFKFNSSDGDSGTIYLFHNTVDAQRASNDGLSIQSPSTWVRVMARNNIWAGTRYAIANNLDPLPPLDMDYDALWGENNNDLVYWQGLSNRHLAFSNVFSATGQENHAVNATPSFVAPSIGDFTLSTTSQLIDRGCPIPGINDGSMGSGPDIGAIESH
jgi:parallel beta-helix repeat protein